MYVVIFRAKIKNLDDQYRSTAARIRRLALDAFGCVAFQALFADGEEVALSY